MCRARSPSKKDRHQRFLPKQGHPLPTPLPAAGGPAYGPLHRARHRGGLLPLRRQGAQRPAACGHAVFAQKEIGPAAIGNWKQKGAPPATPAGRFFVKNNPVPSKKTGAATPPSLVNHCSGCTGSAVMAYKGPDKLPAAGRAACKNTRGWPPPGHTPPCQTARPPLLPAGPAVPRPARAACSRQST